MPIRIADLSIELEATGLLLLDIPDTPDVIPVEAAWMASACQASDGRRDKTIGYNDPELAQRANEAWYDLAHEYQLLDQDSEFLLSLTLSGPDEYPNVRWGLVRLKAEWDIIGAGTANGRLGGPYGRPGFVMLSKSGYTVVAGTTWHDGIGVLAVPNPHRASAIRKYMAHTPKGSVTDREYTNIRKWLSRSPRDVRRTSS